MGFEALAYIAIGAVAGAAAGGAFSKGPGAPPPVKPMPLPDDQSVQDAQRRSVAAQLGRRGRSSTILTGPDDTLGG